MIEIRHLSVSATDPEKSARALAEMTDGRVESFSSQKMSGAWVCIWNVEKNHLIEFLPKYYLMHETSYGADFKKMEVSQNFNSTHFQLETDVGLQKIIDIADKFNFQHKFRPQRGGPLYDVWFEDELLIEFTSDEIRGLKGSF